MDFQVLGTLRVVGQSGAEIRLSSVAQRRLLSMLLQHPGQVVSAQHMDRHLELSAGALRTSISRLRRVVGFDTLVTEPPGYALRSDAIDTVRFERLLHAARRDRDQGTARSTLEQALALWRGPAYAEFAPEAWATAEATRLEGLRCDAVVRLVELLLEAREWADAIGRLETLIEEQPFDDRLRALLMRALADSGRRVEALRSFQRYRTFLLEEVGTEPSVATIALDREIAGSAGACDPPRPPSLRPNLPAPLSSFVGRTEERRIVAGLIAEHRLVSLTGSGGCGKSRLALDVATTLAGAGERGASWIELATVTAPSQVAEAVARAIGCLPVTAQDADVVTQIEQHLLGLGPTLLVVDNAEHVLDAVVEVVGDLLARCPDARVLVTSREALGLAGEMIWRVPSLSLPDPAAATALADLDRFDATRLFLERSRCARRDLVIDDGGVASIVAICTRLDGLPLALELAAARLGSLPLDRVAGGIDDAFGLLGGGARGVLARHQTLEASIAWSVDLLDPADRTALGRLAVFQATFTVEAAVEVLGDDDPGRPDAAGALSRLVDKSLVQLDVTSGRYRLLETIRQFCRANLLVGEDLDRTRSRHARHYARWCIEVGAGLHGIGRGPILREMPDVVTALAWARASEPLAALHMCRGLASVRSTLGHPDDLVDTWNWLVAFDRDGPLAAEWAAAMAASLASATGAGLDVATWVAEIEPRLWEGDRQARGWLVRGAAMVPAYQGHLAPILAYGKDITAQRDDVELSVYGGFAAYMVSLAGLLPDGEALVDDLHLLAHRHGVPFAVDTVGNGFGAAVVCRLQRGRLREIGALVEGAAGRTPLDPAFSITAAAAMAQAATLAGDRELLDQATEWSRLPTLPVIMFLNVSVAFYRALAGADLQEAAHLAARFHEESVAVPVLRVNQRSMLNVALLETGRVAAAAAATEEAASALAGMDAVPMLAAVVSQSRAQVGWCEGRTHDAVDEAHRLLDLAARHGFALLVVDALELLAVAAARRGAEGVAARLLDATLAERDRLGYRFVMHAPRAERDELAATLDRAPVALPISDAVVVAREDARSTTRRTDPAVPIS